MVTNWQKNKLRHKPLFEKTRRQLALWYTGAMGAIVLAAAVGFYLFIARLQYAEVDRDLGHLASTLANTVESESSEAGEHSVANLEHLPFLSEGNYPGSPYDYLRWYSPDWRLDHETGLFAPPRPPAPGLRTLPGTPSHRDQTLAVYHTGKLLGYLEVGLSLAPVEQDLQQVLLVLITGVPLVLITVGVAGWWLAGLAIVPVEASYTRLQQFTADASHELRTPLAALRANAQAALKQPVLAESETREKLNAIDRTSERMGNLVSDLLFLARSESQAVLVRQSCLLEEMLADLTEELAPLAVEAGVHLDFQKSASAPLNANTDQIYRLFTNLITNAIKYTPAGGRVTIELQVVGRQAQVQIEDTGIGIPPEHQADVFERFYRVDSARSRTVGGNGLGLAICRAIVQSHGGSLELARSSPAGTLFVVRLPLAIAGTEPRGSLFPVIDTGLNT